MTWANSKALLLWPLYTYIVIVFSLFSLFFSYSSTVNLLVESIFLKTV